MKLEQQVVSLELAKKLKELGVKQDSFFKWGNVYIDGQYHWSLYVPPEYNKVPNPSLWVHGISAFTVAELGEMLPADIKSYKYEDGRWSCDGSRKYDTNSAWIQANTEADARTKMLIYLIENNLIII